MDNFCLLFLIAGLFCLGANGRAVNISNAWFLPQEGFPVFYRYFSDKVTWNEAEAVCGFHHADLLSVQTSTQMDAARAYLKEIDITDNIWIGLKKEFPEKPFVWTNGEKLEGDGYWIEPIPKTNEELCAAIDPISDFRWNSFYCRGPQVASFVCELPVPEWAKKEDGCMITSLPSLTVTLMPDVEVIQLFSDCGLDGTRRIACKGGVNREEIIKRLSCDVDAFASTSFSKSTTDTVKELNTQESISEGVNEESNRIETTETAKGWETYTPLTRHRRNSDLSALAKAFSFPQEPTQAQKVEQTTNPATTAITNEDNSKIPSHNFPHSPFLDSERNAPSTKTTEDPRIKTNQNQTKGMLLSEKLSTTTPNTISSNASSTIEHVPQLISTLKAVIVNKSKDAVQKVFKSINAKEGNKSESSIGSPSKADLPVLIITGEKLNETEESNINSITSENPQIVFMINNKEGAEERFLIPLDDDVLVNNPSLSPIEVINVDVVEVDNLTTRTTFATSSTVQATPGSAVLPSQSTSPQKPESIHPMKLGQKMMTNSQNRSSSNAPNPTNSSSGSLTTKLPKLSTEEDDKKQESFNAVDHENKGENMEIPQRPNRGRLLTHSSHPSFYPYFLNRVLG